MLGALKTLGTVLTVASTAQFGKEMYNKYKDKKRKRQIDEVHEFIGQLDIEALQTAIDNGDTDALIDAVEAIMDAAEAVKIKSDFDELKDDVSEVAGKVFNKVSSIADRVAAKAKQQFEELTGEDEFEDDTEPTFEEFMNGAEIIVTIGNRTLNVTVDSENVSVNRKTKTITILSYNGDKVKVKTLKLV